ncbi:receptor-like protein 43 [Ziziphus jujuba]|uniref:Receptor-like protein 43 n=1 Tax=Ziziphus jujuba TaxID=326968 RepID=A0ABM4A2Y4_ZIZJJ|nr:receptor-like protein 43 [Ziziphus jujuba]
MDLGFCNFLRVVPSSLCNVSELPYLVLSSNDFNGHLPYEGGNLEKFTKIDLSGNQFSGELPSSLGNLTQLNYLSVDDNNFSSQIPSSLGNLSQLESGREETPLVRPLKKLYLLDLHSNMLRGPVVVPPISTRYFSISENSLVGRIDPLFCKFGDFQYLDLSSNNLSGTVPQCLDNFNSSLLVLNLRISHFRGEMPHICGYRSKSKTLDLSCNQLSGKMPNSLIKRKELQISNLSQNHMGDTFPFWLQCVKSSGHIPSSLGNLVELESLDLSNNKLYGEIPQQ